ncbi:tetratricopeptide repeat protein [Mitsuaria sp. 7]|uniref:tetratricopeptide repeat protein n=1 Tax=Mitsuaria sp. 7 TaxID=1658665 RepID=UPI0007DE299F|nr:tetratricopeptide repeat protein [Mitsuaria sp. 7]ANH66726.1 hypothetical protein ABE85_02550 [Mitsuaria sp. 7]
MRQESTAITRTRLTFRATAGLLTLALSTSWTPAAQAQSLADLRQQFEAPSKAKDWRAAEAVARRMVAQSQSDASDWRQLARVLAAQGKNVEAAEARQELVKRPGATSNDYNNLCWSLLERNQPLDARPLCQTAVDLDPTHANALVNMGHSFLLASDPTQATVWYRRTLTHLQKEEDLREGPLYDLDLFIRKGWAVADARAARQWFEQTWPSVQASRQPRSTAKE